MKKSLLLFTLLISAVLANSMLSQLSDRASAIKQRVKEAVDRAGGREGICNTCKEYTRKTYQTISASAKRSVTRAKMFYRYVFLPYLRKIKETAMQKRKSLFASHQTKKQQEEEEERARQQKEDNDLFAKKIQIMLEEYLHKITPQEEQQSLIEANNEIEASSHYSEQPEPELIPQEDL